MLITTAVYNIPVKNIISLACRVERLQKSSLTFDDPPAQDKSDLRRGRPTLHKSITNDDIPECLYEERAQLKATWFNCC